MFELTADTPMPAVHNNGTRNKDFEFKLLTMNMLQKLINDVITQGSKVSGNVVGNVSGNQTTQERNYLNGLLDFASQMTQNVVAP